MGIFSFGIGDGIWLIYSKKDPRWNTNGRARGTTIAFRHEAELYIESKKEEFGEPPDDLEIRCMKD